MQGDETEGEGAIIQLSGWGGTVKFISRDHPLTVIILLRPKYMIALPHTVVVVRSSCDLQSKAPCERARGLRFKGLEGL